MVPYVVKMAVDIKVTRQESILVGNLEYYYAAGLFRKLTGDETISGELSPHELEANVRKATEHWDPESKEDKYLHYLLDRYEAEDEYTDDMKRMFRIGTGEEDA